MTKAQIIAELRRSAIEDQRPWCMVRNAAWLYAIEAYEATPWEGNYEQEDVAMFFLLLAQALEDEHE
jgi:hypothetical protein